MLEHSPFDACTNTGAETTVSKCFDAISQQSVKQKTFVAFYTVHGKKTVSTQKDAEISQQEPSLFVDATPSPACLSQAERESNTHISSVKDRRRRQVGGGGGGAMRAALMGAPVPCGPRLVKGTLVQRECMDFREKPLKMLCLNTRERSGRDRRIDKDKA